MDGFENKVSLTKDLDIEVLNGFSDENLKEYSDVLKDAKASLYQMIKLSEELNDGLAEDLKVNLRYATVNKDKIDALLIQRENWVFYFGEFATVGLN